jgi:hypothetical protein
LAQTVKRELRLKIDAETYWSDSSTVIRWIYSTHCRYHTWVANRVGEIITLTEAKQWRHVPGVLNPADDCSRGVKAVSLTEDNRWWTGPTFLLQPKTSWPAMPEHFEPPDNDPKINHFKICRINFVSRISSSSFTDSKELKLVSVKKDYRLGPQIYP